MVGAVSCLTSMATVCLACLRAAVDRYVLGGTQRHCLSVQAWG